MGRRVRVEVARNFDGAFSDQRSAIAERRFVTKICILHSKNRFLVVQISYENSRNALILGDAESGYFHPRWWTKWVHELLCYKLVGGGG